MVTDNYLGVKTNHPFNDLTSAFSYMVNLRRKVRKQHAIDKNKAIHHRIYVLKRDSILQCTKCHNICSIKNCPCGNTDFKEEIIYTRVKRF